MRKKILFGVCIFITLFLIPFTYAFSGSNENYKEYEKIKDTKMKENGLNKALNQGELEGFIRDSDVLKKKILDQCHQEDENKTMLRISKKFEEIINRDLNKDDNEVNGAEPVGKSKKVRIFLYVPYEADIEPEFYYEDPYYSGWIPFFDLKDTELNGEKYWTVFYSGTVYYKGDK
ncbi:hypothetical protein [Ezakiella peruensis]|uniref:hypothetical protein n=1 Tax=Ezakiella peruensis TaxID=1464038 RepID=UPI000C1B1720|nr:hypothetical protein [Ezakiella peruensis]